MVTLGGSRRTSAVDGAGNPSFHRGGDTLEQAATFMHELGHTLGLFHAGDQIVPGADGRFGTEDDQEVPLKPNYHSIMNYLWQMPEDWMREDANGNSEMDPGESDLNGNGVFGDVLWVLDYSRRNFGELNESQLLESAGIGGDEDQAVQIGPLVNGRKKVVLESGPVDFNLNGTIDPTAVSANLNGGPNGQILRGFEDWSHLRFYFRELQSVALGASGKASPLADQELTLELRDELNAVGDGPGFFKFSAANTFRVDESAGFATVTVVRSAGTSGTVSVDFATSDGSAGAGVDYVATNGTITFADGEFIKSLPIAILNDLLRE